MASAIADIAEALTRPAPPADRDPLLATAIYGHDPGFALFYAYLDRAAPDRRWRELGQRYLENAIDQIPEASDRPFFSYGFSGAAWAVQHLSGWFVEVPDDALLDIDEGLTTLVETAPTVSFDLQHGLVGFGLYALERLPAPSARRLLAAVVNRLGTMAEAQGPGLAWKMVHAVWVDGPDTSQAERGVYPTDVFNGIAGVIGVLAGALGAGIEAARPLLAGAERWLWAVFDNGQMTMPVETAWSSTLGVVSACFAAARHLGHDPSRALEVARSIAQAREPIREPGIRDGVAGTAHIFYRLFVATGEQVFADAARRHLDRLLRRRRADDRSIGGYRTFTPVIESRFLEDPDLPVGWVAAPGLIRGVAGIGLVLIALLYDQEPAWDRSLVISLRPPQA